MLLLAVLLMLCLGSAGYFIAQNVVALPQDFVPIHEGVSDSWAGRGPYAEDPGFRSYNHPPGSALLLGPVALVPYEDASRVIGLFNLLGLIGVPVGAAWFSLRGAERRRSWPWVLMLTALGLVLGARMGRGNIDVLTCCLLLGGFVALTRRSHRQRREVGAGLLFGAACAVKPTALPFLAPLILEPAFLALGVSAVVLVSATVIAVVRFEEMSAFFSNVLPYLSEGQPIGRRGDASLSALVSRSNALNAPFRIAGGLFLGLLSTWLSWRRRTELSQLRTLLTSSALFGLCALLASPSAFPYYWIYLCPALAVLTDWRARLLCAGALGMILVQDQVSTRLIGLPGVESVAERSNAIAFVLLFAALSLDLLTSRNGRLEGDLNDHIEAVDCQ